MRIKLAAKLLVIAWSLMKKEEPAQLQSSELQRSSRYRDDARDFGGGEAGAQHTTARKAGRAENRNSLQVL
jgi:hypothetical protein